MASETPRLQQPPRVLAREASTPDRRSFDPYVLAQILLGLGIVAVLVTTVWLLRVIGGA
jgi:hypothetical protein